MNKLILQSENVVVSIQPPQPRTIMVREKHYDENDFTMHFIHFPYLVFVSIKRSRYYNYVFASNTPVDSIDDKVALIPLPNIFDSGEVCADLQPTEEIKEYHQNFISIFFQSVFQSGEIDDRWLTDEAKSWKYAKNYKDIELEQLSSIKYFIPYLSNI